MARVPKYREDTKGNLKALIDDCTNMMRGEIANPDTGFVMGFDCLTYSCQEYDQYLTDAELARCFKAACK